MDSWIDLINYTLPLPATVHATASATTQHYSATNPLDEIYASPVAIVDENNTILERAKGALLHGLSQLPNSPTFPTDVNIILRRSTPRTIKSKAGCRYSTMLLSCAVDGLVEAIFEALGIHGVEYTPEDPPDLFSDGKDVNFLVIKRNQTLATSIKFETPAVLARYWGSPRNGLKLQNTTQSTGTEAILIEVSAAVGLFTP